MPQVPGSDSTESEQARDEKSFDNNDLKDDDEGVEKDVDVQGIVKRCVCSICVSRITDDFQIDSTEKNGGEVEAIIINDYVESDSLEEDLQKAISTAERRKVILKKCFTDDVTCLY